MQTPLITGASGLLGGALFRHFARLGAIEGTCFRHSRGTLRPADLRDRDAVGALIRDVNPSAVIHAAACPEPDVCEADPAAAARLNVDPVQWFADLLPAATPFVFISTDYVFDGRQAPYREDDPVCPINVYGRTKADSESLLAGRPNTLIVRIPLQVGHAPATGKPGFVAQMLAQIDGQKESPVDDVLVRVPTWTEDVAAAIAFLLSRQAAGIFHVSSPAAGTRWHWTQELARLLGRSITHLNPSSTVIPRPARRPVDGQLATDKLAALGWSTYTPFAGMVRQLQLP